MNRVEQYCNDVLNGKIIAGESVKLAVKRHLNDLEKSKDPDYPYFFDINAANDIINFAETLVLAEGLEQKKLKLYPFQAFILGSLLGWKHKSNPKNGRYRESFVMLSRQNGKSVLNAIIAAYRSNFLGYKYNQTYLAATSQMQARIVFKEITKFINSDPELASMFKIQDYKSEIQCLNTGGVIKTLSRETKSLDGLRPSTAILDEVHAYTSNQIYKLLSDGTVKLEDTLISAITTAGFNINGFCYEHYLYCKNVLNGTVENDKIFIFIAELDEKDDIWDYNNYYKCAPCAQYDKTLLENMKLNASIAKEKGGEELSNFLVKNLNKFLNGLLDSKYLQPEQILKCKSDKDISFLRDKNVVVGLDLSSGGDLTSLALEYKYSDNGQTKYFIHQHSFLPKMRLQEHIQKDKAPYDIWVKKGLITLTEGVNPYKTDYKYIISYLKDLIKEYNIKIDCIDYDPHNSATFLSDLEEITDNLVEIKQSARSLNDATVDFKLEIEGGNVEFDKNDELLIWSLSNAITTSNSFGEIKLDKVSQNERIDVCDAIIDAHKMVFKQEVKIDLNKHITDYLNRLNW